MKQKLSVIIACYNEEETIQKILDKIYAVQLIAETGLEIIVVDDASTDNTLSILRDYRQKTGGNSLNIFQQERNSGKGSCIRLGIAKITGEITVIQDADLEYDPSDYNRMLEPIIAGHADVVYGSRFCGSGPHRVLFFLHTLGNKFLTFLSNLFTNINLTDMETGYKMFRTNVLKQIQLHENRFGFEPEVTAKISRIKAVRIYEVGISYFGRTYEEGKKVNWMDGLYAIWCIVKYNIFSRR